MGIADSQDARRDDQRVTRRQKKARIYIESQAGEDKDEAPGSLNSNVPVFVEPAATEDDEEGE